jgi:hypothetical protein
MHTAQAQMLYTQKVAGSSPASPTRTTSSVERAHKGQDESTLPARTNTLASAPGSKPLVTSLIQVSPNKRIPETGVAATNGAVVYNRGASYDGAEFADQISKSCAPDEV